MPYHFPSSCGRASCPFSALHPYSKVITLVVSHHSSKSTSFPSKVPSRLPKDLKEPPELELANSACSVSLPATLAKRPPGPISDPGRASGLDPLSYSTHKIGWRPPQVPHIACVFPALESVTFRFLCKQVLGPFSKSVQQVRSASPFSKSVQQVRSASPFSKSVQRIRSASLFSRSFQQVLSKPVAALIPMDDDEKNGWRPPKVPR